ncbi:MAG: hypothetical protein LQ352_002878 [Teloschistes flavicans]|nr:MAG: hypothetical protein LQ352_002878 [Teloschistes flavicans]
MVINSLYSITKAMLKQLSEPNDFRTSTWMAFGATLLLLTQYYLPSRIINLLPILYLVGCMFKMGLDILHLHTRSYTTMKPGKWTAALPEQENPFGDQRASDEGGVVAFMLGARINQFVIPSASGIQIPLIPHSPLGKLTPGAKEMSEALEDMWTEAETNRVKWGCMCGSSYPVVPNLT